MSAKSLNIITLAGGPDRERDISLMSGQQVTAALIEAGHNVQQHDIAPDDLAALDVFETWPADVIFPVLHGPWGEGGGLQRLLDDRRLPYVGSDSAAAALCMDKAATKRVLEAQRLPTPVSQLLRKTDSLALTPPLVIKPLREGSSIDIVICRDAPAVAAAFDDLWQRHDMLMAESFVAGRELTVSVLGTGRDAVSLPPIHIIPAAGTYDYQAKYFRDDTRYLVGRDAIELPDAVLSRAGELAVAAHRALGCRHLSRVDFIADDRGDLHILEVNTLPGFTTHSLTPMAARHAGMDLPAFTDKLVRMALE